MPKLWSYREFMDWKPVYPKSIIGGGVLREGTKAVMFGMYKSLKSMLGLNLAFSVADGVPWLDLSTAQTSTLYIQAEDPEALFHERFHEMGLNWEGFQGNHDLPIFLHSDLSFKLDSSAGLKRTHELIEQSEAGLLIIDPIYKIMSGSMLDVNHVIHFVDAIDSLISQYNLTVLLLHHTRKSTPMAATVPNTEAAWGADDLYGSVVFPAWFTSVLRVSRKKRPDLQHELLTVNFDVVRYAKRPLEELEVIFDRDTMLFNVPKVVL